jgi:AI-2 transport protein TqsA
MIDRFATLQTGDFWVPRWRLFVLEPMLMGRTLNLSPFAIILALAFWGTIWGIAGMFLSVPIMVLMMIVCAHVPGWRWFAVLLSKDGQVESIPARSPATGEP